MKILLRSLSILLVTLFFSTALTASTEASRQQMTNSPSVLNAEMTLHLEQAIAYIDQVESDLATKNSVNVETLHAVLVELTLAQRVINRANSQEKADLSYKFSYTTLDGINHLNKLSIQNEKQNGPMLKAFVSATTYILQEVIEESYVFENSQLSVSS